MEESTVTLGEPGKKGDTAVIKMADVRANLIELANAGMYDPARVPILRQELALGAPRPVR
jgi:hypothetical protein